MKHARAAEFADYLEFNVKDEDFDMSNNGQCIMGHINRRAVGRRIHPENPKYWVNAVHVLGNQKAAEEMFMGNNYYRGIFGWLKNAIYDQWDKGHLRYITKPQAVKCLRHYARTGNVVWG